MYYFAEYTDTFAGEANYSWVKRFKVKANTKTGAIRKVSKELGLQGFIRKDWDSGDTTRYNVQGSATCIFLSEWPEDTSGDNYPCEEI